MIKLDNKSSKEHVVILLKQISNRKTHTYRHTMKTTKTTTKTKKLDNFDFIVRHLALIDLIAF